MSKEQVCADSDQGVPRICLDLPKFERPAHHDHPCTKIHLAAWAREGRQRSFSERYPSGGGRTSVIFNEYLLSMRHGVRGVGMVNRQWRELFAGRQRANDRSPKLPNESNALDHNRHTAQKHNGRERNTAESRGQTIVIAKSVLKRHQSTGK